MQKFLKIFFGVAVVLCSSVALAQLNPFDIAFPISELGNCNSVEECKAYCDNEANYSACFDWAEANGLVSEGLGDGGRDFKEGPGGCTSESECDAYCRQKEHGNECLDFAVAEGFYTEEEARRLREEMNKTGPGGCSDRESCDAFCRNPENSRTCLQFAADEGMITQEELEFLIEMEESRMMGPGGPDDFGPPGGPGGPGGPDDPLDIEKLNELMSSDDFSGPGGCTNMEECDAYCGNMDNNDECFNFAIANGLISSEEAEKFKKLMEMGGPGGCQGPQECDQFCSQPENQETCMNFAIENDMMSPEEIERIKKMMEIEKMGGGPGGCQGREECDAYCSQPGNGEECFAFGKEHGLMPPEEIEKMERGMEIIRKLDRGAMEGPGGCSDRVSCESFCRDPNNMEECASFSSDQGLVDRNEMERKMNEYKRMETFMREMRMPGSMGPDMGSMRPDMGGPMGGQKGVSVHKNSSGMYDIKIFDPAGIKEFSFMPTEGSGYSGGVPGCPKEFKSDTSFFGSAQYPLNVSIINCEDGKQEFVMESSEVDSMGFGEGMPSGGEYGFPPEGFKPPEGYDNFMPPEGFGQPDGFGLPPNETNEIFNDKYESFGDFRDESYSEGANDYMIQNFPPEGYEDFMPPDVYMPPETSEPPREEYIAPPTIESVEESPITLIPGAMMGLIIDSFISIFR